MILEATGCALCGTTSDNVVLEENGYQLRRCPSCGLLYVSPRPSVASIRTLYGHDAARISAEAHIASQATTRAAARHLLSQVGRFHPGRNGGAHRTLLELGAGAGYLLDEARKQGYEVQGIEMNPAQASFIRETLGIACEEEPISAQSFGDKQFDVIVHVDVLSHLVDPIADLRVIRSKLAEGGLLVLETGNFADVAPKHHKELETFQLPDHLLFFGEKTLLELLHRADFELISMRRYSLSPELIATRLARQLVRFTLSLRQRRGTEAGPTTGLLRARASDRAIARFARRALGRAFVWLRYGAGRFAPKAARPQTVLVFARPARGGPVR